MMQRKRHLKQWNYNFEGEAGMTFSVSVGESGFEDLCKTNSYYVDKTDILYELIQNTKNKVTLFTRPRRFGKTLMMSMMLNFFSIRLVKNIKRRLLLYK